MSLLQVMVEYSQTPSGPFSLSRLFASTTGRWLAIALGGVLFLYLFRRSRLGTVLFLVVIAGLVYYGRGRLGW